MASLVIQGIMLASMGLSAVPLIESFFPAKLEAFTVVRIVAGLSLPNETDSNPGGFIPNIALFDAKGYRIGFRSEGMHPLKIGDGRSTFPDLKIKLIDSKNNMPPEYISVSANGAYALCIAYLAVTTPTGDYWTWNGEFARLCGKQWYHSRHLMEGTQNRPACVWISDDQRLPSRFGLRFPDFVTTNGGGRTQQYNNHQETFCQSRPRQGFYNYLTELNCLPVFDPIPALDKNGTDIDFNQVLTQGIVRCEPGPDVHPTWRQQFDLQRGVAAKGTRPDTMFVASYGVEGTTKRYCTKKRSVDIEKRETDKSAGPCMEKHVVVSDIDQHTQRSSVILRALLGPILYRQKRCSTVICVERSCGQFFQAVSLQLASI